MIGTLVTAFITSCFAFLLIRFVVALVRYARWKRRRKGRRLGYIRIKPKRHR